MLEWYRQQSRRDQMALGICAVFVLFYVFYISIWKPAGERLDRMQRATEESKQTLVWMQSAVAEASSLMQQGGASGGSFNGNLNQLAQRSLASQGLKIKRMQPSGDKELQVWVDGAEYAAAMRWLKAMEVDNGLTLKTVAISAANQSGLVSLRVRLQKG